MHNMRSVTLALRVLFVPMAFVAAYELTHTNYVLNACPHGLGCNRFEGTRNGFACASTCEDAHAGAMTNMTNAGFPSCAGSAGPCSVEHWYVTIPCYYDEGSGQYCEEVQQDYGCFYCP